MPTLLSPTIQIASNSACFPAAVAVQHSGRLPGVEFPTRLFWISFNRCWNEEGYRRQASSPARAIIGPPAPKAKYGNTAQGSRAGRGLRGGAQELLGANCIPRRYRDVQSGRPTAVAQVAGGVQADIRAVFGSYAQARAEAGSWMRRMGDSQYVESEIRGRR